MLKSYDRSSVQMHEEVVKLRKTLDHMNLVKFHHSYTEGSSVRCFVLEPLEIATGTFADVAEQRTG